VEGAEGEEGTVTVRPAPRNVRTSPAS
jgi:hypothetical protein